MDTHFPRPNFNFVPHKDPNCSACPINNRQHPETKIKNSLDCPIVQRLTANYRELSDIHNETLASNRRYAKKAVDDAIKAADAVSLASEPVAPAMYTVLGIVAGMVFAFLILLIARI